MDNKKNFFIALAYAAPQAERLSLEGFYKTVVEYEDMLEEISQNPSSKDDLMDIL